MSKPRRDPLVFTTVVCPTCSAKLDPHVRQATYRVECPNCQTEVRVPSLEDVRGRQQQRVEKSRTTRSKPPAGKARSRRDSAPPSKQWTTIVCPTCAARLDYRVKPAAYEVKCPDCYVLVRVPSLQEHQRREDLASTARKRPESVGTYSFQRDDKIERPRPPTVTVVCPKCNARLDPVVKRSRRRVKCPDCHVSVAVPGKAEVAAKKEKEKPPTRPSPVAMTVPEPTYEREVHTSYIAVQDEIRRDPPPPVPRWTFFSRVWTFPWQPGTTSRWVLLSVGCTAIGLLFAFAVNLYMQIGGFSTMMLFYFIVPAIWMILLTSSYAAACCLPILIETAAGNDRIAMWPAPNWKEWMGQLIYVSFIGMESGVMGALAGEAAGTVTGATWYIAVTVSFLLFPIVLLSSLEANSIWVPLSSAILRSLLTCWWGWLTFYLLTAACGSAYLMLVFLGITRSPFATMATAGPLSAALILIYARLLGRLSWRASLAPAPAPVKSEEV